MPASVVRRKSSVSVRSATGVVACAVALITLASIALPGGTPEMALMSAPSSVPADLTAPSEVQLASPPPRKSRRVKRSAAARGGGRRARVSGIVFMEPPMQRDDGPHSWFDPRADQTQVTAASFAEALPNATLEAFATVRSSPLCTFVWVRGEQFDAGNSSAPPTTVTRSPEHERTLAAVLQAYPMPDDACSGRSERHVVVLVVRSAHGTALNHLHLAAMHALLDLLGGKFVSPTSNTTTTPEAALLIDASLAPLTAAEILLQDIATAFTGAERTAVGCALVDEHGSQPTVVHAGYDARVHQRAGGAALVPLHQGVHLDDLPAETSPNALPPTCLALRAADASHVAKQPALGSRRLDAVDPVDVGSFVGAAVPLIASLRAAESMARPAVSALAKVSSSVRELVCPLGRLKTALADGERAIREYEVMSDMSAGFVQAREGGTQSAVDYHGQLLHRCTHEQHRLLAAIPVRSIPALVRHVDGQVGVLPSDGLLGSAADFFGRVNVSALAARAAFLDVSHAPLLRQTAQQVGIYADLLATLHADARTAPCAECSDRCQPDKEGEDVREAIELCRGSRQALRSLLVAVKDVVLNVTANARRLSHVTAQIRGVCASSADVRGWLRVSRALQDAGLVTALPMAASVVAGLTPGAFARLPFKVRPTSLVRQPGYLPASLGSNDPIGIAYEGEIRADFATLGARVHWAPPCSCCGFTVEVAWILQGLRERLDVVLAQHPRCFCTLRNERNGKAAVDEGLWQSFASPAATPRQTFLASRPDPDDVVEIAVHHWDPINEGSLKLAFKDDGGGSLSAAPDVRILRTMYEFSRVPTSWNAKLLSERFDEIWVPGDVVRQAYINSGIPASLFFVVPEAVDVDLYSPDSPAPKFDLPLPKGPMRTFTSDVPAELIGDTFKFCAVSKYELRKGWDVLFRAFFEAFDNSSTASLHVCTHLTYKGQVEGATSLQDSDAISRHIVWEYGARKVVPPFEVITAAITDDGVVSLYKGCDAFVLPSRGEGWGLPMMQAMAMGLPTITTKGSGMDAFTTPETAILIEADRVRIPAAAREVYGLPSAAEWLEPRHDALVAALRRVAAMSSKSRRALGSRARAHMVKHFRPSVVADIVAQRVVELEKRVRARWMAEGPPPLQGGDFIRKWNCTATFASLPSGHD